MLIRILCKAFKVGWDFNNTINDNQPHAKEAASNTSENPT